MKHIFPENDKLHEMDTRYTEKYKVMHANTGRLENSPIIYMQKMLNEETKLSK